MTSRNVLTIWTRWLRLCSCGSSDSSVQRSHRCAITTVLMRVFGGRENRTESQSSTVSQNQVAWLVQLQRHGFNELHNVFDVAVIAATFDRVTGARGTNAHRWEQGKLHRRPPEQSLLQDLAFTEDRPAKDFMVLLGRRDYKMSVDYIAQSWSYQRCHRDRVSAMARREQLQIDDTQAFR